MDGNVFKSIIKVPNFETCQFLSKQSRQNIFIGIVLKIFKDLRANIKECPFVGNMTMKNLSLNDKTFFMMPQGTFKFTSLSTSENDEMLLYVSVQFQIEDN